MKQLFVENSLSVYADEQISFNEDSTSVIVRCWKKDSTGLEQLFRHLCDVKEIFSFDQLILSIDFDLDQGFTLTQLTKLPLPFPVIPVQVSGPSDTKNWTRLLNGPLAYLYRGGVRQGKIFNLSFDSIIDLQSLGKVVSLMDDHHPACCASIRRTPENLITHAESEFLRRVDPGTIRYFMHRVADYARNGLGHHETWEHYLKYLFRNTAMMWDFVSLISAGGFDPVTNATGGQEELALICMLLRTRNFCVEDVINSDAILWYEDTRLASGDPVSHRNKMKAEEASIRSILERYQQTPDIVPDFSF